MWWGTHQGFCFFPFGLLLIFVLCFVVCRIFLFRRFNRPYCGTRQDNQDAEAILKRRLASGEITEAEYKQLKDLLRS